jgi:hypothetical protein
VLGLAAVVAAHELAEVLVIANGIRAARRTHLPPHPALRTAGKRDPGGPPLAVSRVRTNPRSQGCRCGDPICQAVT